MHSTLQRGQIIGLGPLHPCIILPQRNMPLLVRCTLPVGMIRARRTIPQIRASANEDSPKAPKPSNTFARTAKQLLGVTALAVATVSDALQLQMDTLEPRRLHAPRT